MAFVPDFTQPGEDQLLAMINDANSKSYTFSDIEFDPPQQTTQGEAENTLCNVRAIPGSGLKGSVTVYYNRLDLETLFTGYLDIPIDPTTTLSEILDGILDEYGINLSADDVTYAATDNAQGVLTAKGGSFLLTGNVDVYLTGAEMPDETLLAFDGDPILGFDNELILGFTTPTPA